MTGAESNAQNMKSQFRNIDQLRVMDVRGWGCVFWPSSSLGHCPSYIFDLFVFLLRERDRLFCHAPCTRPSVAPGLEEASSV